MVSTQRPAIERLLRGISSNHVETVRDAWRELLAEGHEAVPKVRRKLASPVWSKPPRGPVGRYLGVLLALLDELDRVAFRAEVQRLQRTGIHAMHRATLDVMAQRLEDRPAAWIGPGVPVYVARDVTDRKRILRKLTRWSSAPGLELENVSRIDVISRHPSLDYLGLYRILFSGIVLTWPGNSGSILERWADRFGMEMTFYHEVGHHACGHIKGGQIAEQEREADAYSGRIWRGAHPVAVRILTPPVRILRWVLPCISKAWRERAAEQRNPTD